MCHLRIIMKPNFTLVVAKVTLTFLVVSTSVLLAITPQPPALPGIPDQASIEGGLTLLATAEREYAWKNFEISVSYKN